MLPHAPSVQMQSVPEDALNDEDDVDEDKANPADQRISSMFFYTILIVISVL